MVILVDPPRWPAHGTSWAHLVSDASLAELHAFAREVGLPARGFDLDHYDVPAHRVPHLITAGAQPVSGRELLARLVSSGLRVRGADRSAVAAGRRGEDLTARWHAARPAWAGPESWSALGADLLGRWQQPHRRYHDALHLHEVLVRLEVLAEDGEPVTAAVPLAAWFHDAVYAGAPGTDEEDSARLAESSLRAVGGAEVAPEVARLVRLTAHHDPHPDDAAGAALSDADLGILAAAPARYARYAAAVRAEYAAVPEPAFRRGRRAVLRRLLERPRIFASAAGRARWETAARANLAAELDRLGP